MKFLNTILLRTDFQDSIEVVNNINSYSIYAGTWVRLQLQECGYDYNYKTFHTFWFLLEPRNTFFLINSKKFLKLRVKKKIESVKNQKCHS